MPEKHNAALSQLPTALRKYEELNAPEKIDAF
jgi:hypothetical protein